MHCQYIVNILQYIQDVSFDGEQLIVVCFRKDQAALLLERPSFEVDMGFKRVHDEDINEIVLAAFIPEAEKGLYAFVMYSQCIANRFLSRDVCTSLCEPTKRSDT
jgi:hypothetical protein